MRSLDDAHSREGGTVGASVVLGQLELGVVLTRKIEIGFKDFTQFNRIAAEYYGEPPFDGTLGNDVLDSHLAVVDFAECDLFLYRSVARD